MIAILVLGLALGFLGAVPIAGPISVLVLAQGLRAGFQKAFATAVGGALAEGLYAFLAFWGVRSIMTGSSIAKEASYGITSAMLFVVGILLLKKKKKPLEQERLSESTQTKGGFLLGLTVSIFNPTLLFTWAAASQAIISSRLLVIGPWEALPFALGVTTGLICWFFVLLALIARYRTKFRQSSLETAVHWIGLAIMAIAGVFALLQIKSLTLRV